MYSIHLNLPRYTSKDFKVMVLTMLPAAILLNSFLFGARYFTEVRVFAFATVVTFIVLACSYYVYHKIALVLRNRFADEEQQVKRMTLSILVFILLSGVILSFISRGYAAFNFLDYSFNDQGFARAFVACAIINVFVTFLNEGIAKFESYRITASETEELKKEYMKSQLLGLRSQVNPHFLFNSLNTLSCLIHDDEEKAERFLDEMTKVYRYLLKGNDEQLVKVDVEINMLRSYFYLLKERYGDAIDLKIDVNANECEQLIPPLTLQILFEHIINNNSLKKDQPLKVELSSTDECWVQLKHNVQTKLCCPEEKDNMAVDNIAKKFRLLSKKEVVIKQEAGFKAFQLPLITPNETVAA
jgi:two-component system, LytTR family, sensor kinase